MLILFNKYKDLISQQMKRNHLLKTAQDYDTFKYVLFVLPKLPVTDESKSYRSNEVLVAVPCSSFKNVFGG